jgi:hypothetical protein
MHKRNLARHDRHGLRCGCIDYPTRNAESEARGVWQPKKVLKKILRRRIERGQFMKV